MKTPDFFRFVNHDPVSSDRPFNGLLSFLPHPTGHVPPDAGIPHATFEDQQLQWLEIKGRIHAEKLQVELAADAPRYWLLFQLAGSSEVYLPHAIRVAAGGCFGFGSKRSKIPLVLDKGNAWLLLVACKSELIPLLAHEFEQLGHLQDLLDEHGPWDVITTEKRIDAALRRRLQDLEKMKYKAFSTPILLSEWLLRSFQQLHQSTTPPTHGQITLYHEALQYIRTHYLEEISVASIAEELNVSVRKLHRAFEDRPMKIVDFIQKLKLNKARELLFTTDRPIDEISRELNFSDPKYFSKRYRQHFFESPTEFRLQYEQRK